MINQLIPLVSSFLETNLLNWYFFPLFCIYFIAAVPSIFRELTRWR